MKTIYSYMFATVAMFAVVACEKADFNLEDTGEKMTFNASSNIISKTVIGTNTDNETVSMWSGTEKIYVFGDTKQLYTSPALSSPSTETTFTGTALNGPYMAISPSSAVGNNSVYTSNTQTVTNVTIPHEQIASAGSYDAKAALSVAYSEDKVLAFKNVTALLKFKVGEEGITKVCFYGGKNEPITGTGTVSFNGGDPTFTPSASKTYVDVYANSNKSTAFTKGKTYYIAVLPNDYQSGFTVKLNDDNENIRTVKVSYDLNRNMILDLGTIFKSTEMLVVGEFNSWKTSVADGGTPMFYYEKFAVHAAKNVPVGNKAFKFFTKWYDINIDNKSGYVGGNSSNLAKNTLHNIGTQNITISGAQANSAYDLYYFKGLSKFYIVDTNTSPWGVCGTHNGTWTEDIAMTPEKDYFVTKGFIAKTANTNWKFRFKGSWDVEYPSGSDLKIASAGTYDICIKKDMTGYAVVSTGTTPTSWTSF